jgi:hypothetical protein
VAYALANRWHVYGHASCCVGVGQAGHQPRLDPAAASDDQGGGASGHGRQCARPMSRCLGHLVSSLSPPSNSAIWAGPVGPTRDCPARSGVKLETPSVNPGWLVGLLLAGRLVLARGAERCPRTGPGPEGSRGAEGAPAGTRSALDAGGSGPVIAGLPADRPNAAGCRVPAAPRPMLALGRRSPGGGG